MKLERLLAEVDLSKAKRDESVERSSPGVGASWIVKADLAFDLARRLKLAVKALRRSHSCAKLNWDDGSCDGCSVGEALREIEGSPTK